MVRTLEFYCFCMQANWIVIGFIHSLAFLMTQDFVHSIHCIVRFERFETPNGIWYFR